jgi:hypothetical protein
MLPSGPAAILVFESTLATGNSPSTKGAATAGAAKRAATSNPVPTTRLRMREGTAAQCRDALLSPQPHTGVIG